LASLDLESREVKHSGTILGEILLYQKTPMSWFIVLVEQLVSRFPKIRTFSTVKIFLHMAKNDSVHGLVVLTLFSNQAMLNDTLAIREHF